MKNVVYVLLMVYSVVFHLDAKSDLSGIRYVQPRSTNTVTIWFSHFANDDPEVLENPQNYHIFSYDDASYAKFRYQHPVSVDRFSKTGSFNEELTGWKPFFDHLVHLRVEEPFEMESLYLIEVGNEILPEPISGVTHFRINHTPNPSFKLNQVGYSNSSEVKYIYLSSYLGDGKPEDLDEFEEFNVINASTGETEMTGSIEWVSDHDLQGKDKLYKLDISNLKKEGWFYVLVEGLGISYTFQNGNGAMKTIYDAITRGLYFQRRGTALVQPWAADWARPICHNEVYVTDKNVAEPWGIYVNPADPEAGDYYVPQGASPITGGHYDAGDYDTRLTHFAVSEKLMTLYEGRPGVFKDGQSFIPESGNGIPDILDEVLWGLKHYEMLQDYQETVRGEPGSVSPGVETYTHPGLLLAMGDADVLPYYSRKATPYTSFCGAAVFAQAARVFKNLLPERAAKFLDRACAAYDWAEQHRNEKWNSENPKVVDHDWEEVYDDGNLAAAQCWAASQMYASTGNEEYWADFEEYNDQATRTFQDESWTCFYAVFAHEHHHDGSDTVAKWRNRFLAKAEQDLALARKNGADGYFAMCRNKGEWGKANPIANIELLSKAFLLTGKQAYRDAVACSIDFTLGMNPSEFSWMTGAGTVTVMDPMSDNCKWGNTMNPQPGIVIFGPSDNYKDENNLLYPNPDEMGFYRRISDSWGYVQGCEFVIDEQMANMLLGVGILME